MFFYCSWETFSFFFFLFPISMWIQFFSICIIWSNSNFIAFQSRPLESDCPKWCTHSFIHAFSHFWMMRWFYFKPQSKNVHFSQLSRKHCGGLTKSPWLWITSIFAMGTLYLRLNVVTIMCVFRQMNSSICQNCDYVSEPYKKCITKLHIVVGLLDIQRGK